MKETSEPPKWRSLIFPISVIGIAIALIVGVLVLNNREDNETSAPSRSTTTSDGPGGHSAPERIQGPESIDLSVLAKLDEDYPLAVGDVNAPVVLVVVSDFQCSFCARWSTDTLPTMLDYVDQSKLRIEWIDIALFGPDSERAARAAYAAGLQGKYLEYHDALFSGGQIRSASELTDEALLDTARQLRLDIDQFATDFASDTTAQAVQDNHHSALEVGAMSTPAFVMNGQPIVGAQPTDVFVSALEAALQGQ